MYDISRLGLDIETAGVVQGTTALDSFTRATDRAERGATKLEQTQRRMTGQMSVMQGAARQLAAQLGAAFGVWATIRANDAWVSATNQIRLVTESAAELRDVTQEVYDLSQRTASRFEAMAGLYASIERAAGSAIGSQRELLRLTETIAKFASASGGPEASRNAALFQLRQMLQGSVVQAQEFNSLIDGTPLLVQAIADSLGVTRSQLRQMVLDGRLAVSQVISALQEQADEADAIFSRVSFTMADAFTRLQNAFQKLVGTNLGPVFTALVNTISFVAEHLEALVPILSGVAAAVAVAFAPATVVAFGGAIKALFGLIAAHPFAALVGALVAAAVAIHEFGDEITVANRKVETLTVRMVDGVKHIERQFVGVRVTLKDVFDQLWDDLTTEAQKFFTTLAERQTRYGAQSKESVQDQIDSWQEFAVEIIDAFDNVYAQITGLFDSLAGLWDVIVKAADVAWRKIVNIAIGGAEVIANHMARAMNPVGTLLGLQPEIHFDRIDTTQAERDLAQAWDGVNRRFEQHVRDTHPIRDMVDGLVERASGRALARQQQEERDASEAAAAAAAQVSAELAKQIKARQQIFDDLQHQLDLSEREYEIYAAQQDLLKQFPDFYRQQSEGAEAAARADAERLVTLRHQVEAKKQLQEIERGDQRTRSLIAALGVSADEYELVQRTFDLMERFPDQYNRLEEGAQARARAEASVQLALEKQEAALRAQAERAREIAQAPVKNFMEGLDDAESRFWDEFVDDAGGAIDNIGDAFKDMFKRLQADILKAFFDPVYQAIRSAIQNAMQGGFGNVGGFGGGAGNIFSQIGSLFGGSGSGGGGIGSFISQIFGNGFSLSGAGGAHGGGDWMSNMTSALGASGGLSSVLGNIGMSFALSQVGSGIASALGLVKKQAGGQIGGTIGGMIGSFVGGPIGSIIGSFLGSTIGGLFGPGVTSGLGNLSMGASGRVTRAPWGVGGDDELPPEIANALNDVAKKVSDGQALINQMGGDISVYISRLALASEREQSSYGYTDRATGQVINNDVNIGSVADPNALANAALGELLKNTTFSDGTLEAVRAAMLDAGKGFEETLEVLGKLADVLPKDEEATSQWKEALDTLNETFEDLRATTADVAGVAAQLDDAYASAMAKLKEGFSSSIEDAITQIESPLTLQFDTLLKTQAQRLADATALGVDTARVMHLNELELKQFIQQAGGSAEAFANLNDIFAELIAKAQAAGNATQPLIDAYNQARDGVVSAFNDDVAQQLANITNPTLGALKALLDAQKSRLEQARAIGANITAVERLNAAEQQAFFEGLTDEQKQALASYLGLIEDFTGRIAVVLSQLGDELNARIDDTNAMREDLLRQADAMRTLAENLSETRQGIVDRYGPATPQAAVEALRERLTELMGEAQAGNDSALNAIGQVGQQLIEASRNLYGSTSSFRGDYELVTSILQQAEALAGDRADSMESQAQTLLEQRDLLIEIRDILSQPDPAIDTLNLRLSELDANQDAVKTLLEQYLQLAAQSQAQVIDIAAVAQQSTNTVSAPSLSTSPGVSTITSGAGSNVNTSGATQTGGTAAGAALTPADSATAQMIAVLVDTVQQGNNQMVEAQEDTRREIRNLNARLGVGGADV